LIYELKGLAWATESLAVHCSGFLQDCTCCDAEVVYIKKYKCCTATAVCLLQVAGLTAVVIGIFARLDNNHDDLMSQLPTLPALLLIAVGSVGSLVGFVGFLGAVRESFCLLKTVIKKLPHLLYK